MPNCKSGKFGHFGLLRSLMRGLRIREGRKGVPCLLLAQRTLTRAVAPRGEDASSRLRALAPSSPSDSAFHQLRFQAPYNVLITCNWGDLAIEPSFQPAGPLTGPYLFRFIALTGASRPLSGRGEDEHSLQVPRHGLQTPLAAHFLQPAQ